ncbi:MAG: hypothetical protein EBU31_16665 [Proteobacteria bacterium]|nr:hypothetical protein [Pseudomonadota bacterium]
MRRFAVGALMCAFALTGCNTMEGDDSMQLGSQDYARAFDACVETGRDEGMPPSLADLQSTVQYERRRVRFVFMPAEFEPEAIDGKGPFNGAAQPDSPTDRARFDLETYEGILELRTRVFIERGFVPGIRTNTWSSTLTTTTTEPRPRGRDDGTDRMPTQWTPIGRDEAAERTMMRAVRARLSESTQGAEAVTSGQTADAPSS